jgi:predicted enzyme related to lactoylglutathione lyase
MNGKVAQVTIVVNDQTAALAFYTEKAGFEKKTDFTPPGGTRWVTVGLPGQDLELALFQVGTRTDPRDHSSAWRPGTGPSILIRVDDCKATFAELSARGVKFRDAQPLEQPWGTVATFADPDGNHFSLLQPPARAMSG